MKRSIYILVTLFLLLPLTAFAQIGRVTGLKGTVQFRVKNNIPYGDLKNGAALEQGNWIRTGQNGWVELTLEDNSKFTLANNTEFELTSFLLTKEKREGSFYMTGGKLRASVVKLAGRQSGMTVRSATAVAGIKGTEFLMMSEGPANVFFGNQGSVAVSGDGRGAEQPLSAGTMTQNTRGFSPLEPLKVEPGSPLSEARAHFDKATATMPPAEWSDSGKISDIIARWNINHGHYLADSGKYADALHVFQIALDLSKVSEIKADAHMERGAVYARFLNNPELALAEYLLVIEEYPRMPQAETALFNAAQTLVELGFIDQARTRFGQYLNQYPTGKHKSNVETLLQNLGR